ncbi:MAG: hypothetical protein Q4C95_11285 [Planctomycetia bacterium]|nr:hypothetical protein [Planctomycetia bacterium]
MDALKGESGQSESDSVQTNDDQPICIISSSPDILSILEPLNQDDDYWRKLENNALDKDEFADLENYILENHIMFPKNDYDTENDFSSENDYSVKDEFSSECKYSSQDEFSIKSVFQINNSPQTFQPIEQPDSSNQDFSDKNDLFDKNQTEESEDISFDLAESLKNNKKVGNNQPKFNFQAISMPQKRRVFITKMFDSQRASQKKSQKDCLLGHPEDCSEEIENQNNGELHFSVINNSNSSKNSDNNNKQNNEQSEQNEIHFADFIEEFSDKNKIVADTSFENNSKNPHFFVNERYIKELDQLEAEITQEAELIRKIKDIHLHIHSFPSKKECGTDYFSRANKDNSKKINGQKDQKVKKIFTLNETLKKVYAKEEKK